MRQIVLDTETTGLEPEKGHRVVELGAVEIVDRQVTGNRIQFYIDPEREIDDAAYDVHGIDQAFLAGKPKFADVVKEFLDFVADALTEAELEAVRAPIREKYEREGSPYYATARLWDDGILTPAETRDALALGLAVACRAPIESPSYGVFRM